MHQRRSLISTAARHYKKDYRKIVMEGMATRVKGELVCWVADEVAETTEKIGRTADSDVIRKQTTETEGSKAVAIGIGIAQGGRRKGGSKI